MEHVTKRFWISLLLAVRSGVCPGQTQRRHYAGDKSATATSARMARAKSGHADVRASTRLPSEGLRLDANPGGPGCTPSRAALMTGRYSVRSGLSAVIVGGTPIRCRPGR